MGVSKRFLLKRLLLLIPVLFGVATLVFAILHLAPGNPARSMLGQRASEQAVRNLEQELGLTRPIWIQYLDFLSDAATFDFGQSYKIEQNTPVRKVLLNTLPVTIELALYGQLAGIAFGIPLGVISAVKQDTATDHLTRVGALTGISVPIFWSGPLLIMLFSIFLPDLLVSVLSGLPGGQTVIGVLEWLGIKNGLPTSGRIDSVIGFTLANHWRPFTIIPRGVEFVIPWLGGPIVIAHGTEAPLTGLLTVDTLLLGNYKAFWSVVRHLFMPVMVIGIYSMALISRMMRSSMLEVVRQDYIRTARAKGQGAKITLMKHGFRNALIPVVTVVGIQFGTLLGGAVLTETVFGIPGIGTMLVDAIEATDYPLVQGTVLTFALLFTMVNLGVDVTYSYLDPRIQQ